MFSIKNDLLQKSQIQIQLDFINKIKYTQRYETLKNIIQDNFSELVLSQENSQKPFKRYFLTFSENTDNKNNPILK